MKIAISQINTTVGDLSGNVERCLGAIHEASLKGPDLIVFPEMVIPGYPPRDLLYDPSFVDAVGAAGQDLLKRVKFNIPVLFGSFSRSPYSSEGHPGLYNEAYLLADGDLNIVARKRLLPGYDVFYEPRWFVPGGYIPPFMLNGKRIGVIICEDLWDEGYPVHPGPDLIADGAELIVCISASPFKKGIREERQGLAARYKCPFVYANLVGANDELVFDGSSFYMGADGKVTKQLNSFVEEISMVELGSTVEPAASEEYGEVESVYQALVLGVRDFANKNGLGKAFLGLSGGVDSSVVVCIAAEALKPENVVGIAIPSRYTDPRSTVCAEELAGNLGIQFEKVFLEPMHLSMETSLGAVIQKGTAAENIQARLRMTILMAFANQIGGFLLNTSNKTELALGYATLYGDMAGSLGPIADLTKPEVYQLARWIQKKRGVIPDFAIERAPTAELKPGQVDPFDYDKVSPYLDELVRNNQSNQLMRRSEHKRWQMGIVLKVSKKSFGSGRMIPVTRK